MNPHERIEAITEELRDLCKTENEALRLIAEMVTREFPDAAEMVREPELTNYVIQIDDLKDEIKRLNDDIDSLNARGYSLDY